MIIHLQLSTTVSTMLHTTTSTSSSVPKGAIFTVLAVMTVLQFGLTFPTLYFAFQEENASCQHGTRAGLTLSSWLKGSGFADVAVMGLYWIFAFVAQTDAGQVGFMVTYISSIIFTVVWWIIGVVVVSTNENNSCVAEGNALGIMTIIVLVLGSVVRGCTRASNSN